MHRPSSWDVAEGTSLNGCRCKTDASILLLASVRCVRRREAMQPPTRELDNDRGKSP
jgi:hypothetical protein